MHGPSLKMHRETLFGGGGDMGRRIVAHDWSRSSLGPVETWPVELVNAIGMILPAGAEIVLFWGPDYVAVYNDAYAPTIGDKHPGALGCPASECWAELWDDLEPLLAHVRTTGETYSARDRPFYIERAGFGEEVYFDISYSAIRKEDGSVGGVLCIVSETTERVRAAHAVAEDRARLAEMFDQAPSFMTVVRGPNHIYELANRSYLHLIGEARDDLIGKPMRDVLPEMEAQGYMELLDSVVASGRSYRADAATVSLQRLPGVAAEERIVDFLYQPITDDAGKVTGVFIIGSDVTDRFAAEAELRLSRESLALATDAAEIGTWDLDVTSDVLDWSARTKAMFGISPNVPCSMSDFYAGLHPDDFAATGAAFAAAIDPDQRAIYDVVYRTVGAEDGVVRWIAARGRGIFEGDRCIRALGTTIDITARMQQAELLRESEERFRALADTAPALIWQTDASGDVTFANRWFETLMGKTPAMVAQDGWASIVHPDARKDIATGRSSVFAKRLPYGGEIKILGRKGEARWIHAEGRPRYIAGEFAGYVGCAVDVTDTHIASETLEQRIVERTAELTEQIAERERVEATLHQMQRLEAVGQLTSGVAHDFNNLLTVVLGNVGMIERTARQAALDARTLQRLEHVRVAAERGAALTAQLLAFSRKQRLEAKVVDLNDTVAGMRGLLESTLGGAIAIDTDLADGVWPALVDPTQIELIILNLAINARDAMGAAGGALTIETRNVVRDVAERPEEPPAGDYVMVAVADTGSGMSADVLARAFEPFFTTKEVGAGSGLGLAQVFGFAKQSGGGVRIDSREGEGTVVRVYLPRTDALTAHPVVPAQTVTTLAANTHVVLVLDDDDAVRAVTSDALRDAGCRVIEASDGAAALAAITAEPAIEAVVADFAMPGMNGAEFARHAKVLRPALPVIFVTGYADLSAIGDVPEDRVIQKPYPDGAVAERVRRILG